MPNDSFGYFNTIFDANNAANNIVEMKAIIQQGTILNASAIDIQITSGTVKIQDSWENPKKPADRPYAEWIGGAGQNKIGEVPNFLILVEGCKCEDRANANLLVTTLMNDLNKNSKSPWNLFNKSINLWLLFIPSENGAVTVQNELVKTFWLETVTLAKPFNGNSNTFIPTANTTQLIYLGYNPKDPAKKTLEITKTETKKTKWYSFLEFIELIDDILQNRPKVYSESFWDGKIKDAALKVGDPLRYINTPLTPVNPSNNELILSKLIEIVGLPTLKDKSPGVSKMAIITKWNTLYDPSITNARIKDHVFSIWQSLSDRRLPNETNTAYGTAFGTKPRVDLPFARLKGTERGGIYRKLQRDDINLLLKDIIYDKENGTPTNTWSILPGGNTGKDAGSIVFIGNKTRRGGGQIPGQDDKGYYLGKGIFVNLEDDSFCNLTNGIGRQVNLSEPSFPLKPNSEALAVFTHEMAHSFQLSDEYGGQNDAFPGDKNGFNTQPESALLKITDTINNGRIDGNKIKWRWPRIAQAGVLSNITPAGLITLIPGHETGFKVNDEVFLRLKDIVDPKHLDQTPAGQYSAKLTVSGIDPINKTITVSGLANPGYFKAGSLLIKLVEAKVTGIGTIATNGTVVTGTKTYFESQVNPVGMGGSFLVVGTKKIEVISVTNNTTLILKEPFSSNLPSNTKFSIIQRDSGSANMDSYKELLNYTIRMVINKNEKPMTLYPYIGPVNENQPQSITPAQLLVDRLKNIFNIINNNIINNNIVGLYTGGSEYEYGIFHPTGFCHMRNTDQVKKTVSLFCPVCRYILVDKIDPSKHSDINKDKNSNFIDV